MKNFLLVTFLFVFAFTQAQTTPLFKVKVEAYGGDGNCSGFIRLSGCDNYTYFTTGVQIQSTNATHISPACAGTYTVVVSDANLNNAYFVLTMYSNYTSISGTTQNLELFSTTGNYYSTASVPPNCTDSIGLNIRGGYSPYTITWLDSLGNILPNETDSVLQNICSYNYNFYISDAGFCANSVGNNFVKLSETKSDIEIFPNPSDGNFTIKSSKSIRKIEIKSITGQTVHDEKDLNLEENNLSLNIQKGIYFVISTNTNGSCHFEKLVVN